MRKPDVRDRRCARNQVARRNQVGKEWRARKRKRARKNKGEEKGCRGDKKSWARRRMSRWKKSY